MQKYFNLTLFLILAILFNCKRKESFIVVSTIKNDAKYYDFENSRFPNYAPQFYKKYQLIPIIKNNEIIFLNQIQDSVHKIISLKSIQASLEKIDYSPYYPIFIKDFDSIFYFDDKQHLLYLINQKGEVTNKIFVKITDDSTYDIETWAFQNGVFINNDFLFLHIEKKGFDYTKPETIKTVYNSNNYIYGSLNNDTIFLNKYTGKYPEIYSQKFFYITQPNICINNKSQIIYSFSKDHNLYIYQNDTLVLKKEAKSKYAPNEFIPFDLSQYMNIKYVLQYQVNEPKYSNIYFDAFNNCYYRVFLHSENIKKNNTKLAENKWSLIILDSSFNKTNEIIFNPEDYIPSFISISITNKGLLLLSKRKNDKDTNCIYFSLINIK